jgi:hypothetical protein
MKNCDWLNLEYAKTQLVKFLAGKIEIRKTLILKNSASLPCLRENKTSNKNLINLSQNLFRRPQLPSLKLSKEPLIWVK